VVRTRADGGGGRLRAGAPGGSRLLTVVPTPLPAPDAGFIAGPVLARPGLRAAIASSRAWCAGVLVHAREPAGSGRHAKVDFAGGMFRRASSTNVPLGPPESAPLVLVGTGTACSHLVPGSDGSDGTASANGGRSSPTTGISVRPAVTRMRVRPEDGRIGRLPGVITWRTSRPGAHGSDPPGAGWLCWPSWFWARPAALPHMR
jgi:hypothetical protein